MTKPVNPCYVIRRTEALPSGRASYECVDMAGVRFRVTVPRNTTTDNGLDELLTAACKSRRPQVRR